MTLDRPRRGSVVKALLVAEQQKAINSRSSQRHSSGEESLDLSKKS